MGGHIVSKAIKAGIRYIKDKNYRFVKNDLYGIHRLSDEEYIKRMWQIKMDYPLNLDNPQTFNEKLQWLKLHDHREEYTTMVDKFAVKDYISKTIGSQYVIPLLGVWNRFEEIDFTKLPNQFVLKTTHGCGGMYICRDKNELNVSKARSEITRKLNFNYYYTQREWPYKNVPPKIIAEKYMQDGDTLILNVFKVFNFAGIPRIIQVIQNDKTPDETIDYFDIDWNLLEVRQNYPNSVNHLKRPANLDEMLRLSAKCSQGIPFVRTDWYCINGNTFFSEFTFYSDAGFERFYPNSWDMILGNYIQLKETGKAKNQ